MTSTILPAILMNKDVRAAEANRLANEIFRTSDPDTIADIARYGEFVENGQDVPGVTTKDFCRAVATLRPYQDMIQPLRDWRARLDDFDDVFAATLYRLNQSRFANDRS